MGTRALLLVPAFWLGVAVVPAVGRLVEPWSYDDLLKEADLVVVAVAKTTEDTADKPTDPRFKENLDGIVGRTSTLEVKGTLKGKPPGAEVKVLHFRLKEGWDIPNGPGLVAFRTGPATVKAKGQQKVQHHQTEYLLFLKARKDGRYEPVAGQYDTDQSVRVMYPTDRSIHGK